MLLSHDFPKNETELFKRVKARETFTEEPLSHELKLFIPLNFSDNHEAFGKKWYGKEFFVNTRRISTDGTLEIG